MRTTNKRWPLVTVAALVLGALGPVAASAQPAAAVARVVTAVPASGVQWPDRIEQGERLFVGEELVSQNGDYRLVLTMDGSLEIRTPRGGSLWHTRPAGPNAYLTVKSDGKLVLYNRDGRPIWYNDVRGAESVAVIQDTGHLVHYLGENATWHTSRKAFGPDLDFPPADEEGQPEGAAPEPDPTPVTAPAPSPSTSRNSALHPFASSSIWNSAIGSGARFQAKADWRTASFLSGKPVINRDPWSITVVRAKTTDPLVTLEAVRNGVTHQIRIPANTQPTGGSDMHVTIISPDGKTAYDTFKMEKLSSTRWRAAVVNPTDLKGSGINYGTRAAGVPAFAGLIRSHELAAKKIPHALAIAVPNEILKSGHIWPAKRQDTNGAWAYSGGVPMGSLLAIPGNVDLDSLGLSPEGMALGKALQNYGGYVVDRSGMVSLYCEQACNETQTHTMAAAWKQLYPLMRAVTNSAPDSIGGGGTPRVADPAPLP